MTIPGNIIAVNGNQVRLWMRNPVRAEEINLNHENSDYLTGYALDSKIVAPCVLGGAVAGVDIVFLCVP